MDKVSISSLVIEVTRKCNMECDHCMRGKAENLDMDLNLVRSFFSQVESIGALTFTGGEPSLVPHIIDGIIEIAKEMQIPVDSFYIVTNAKKVTDEWLKTILNVHLYCSDGEDMNRISISNDGFHEEPDNENIKKLMAFRFTEKRHAQDYYNYDGGKNLIREGNAALNFCCNRDMEPKEVIIDEWNTIDDLVFNCKGNFISDCDLSFKTQDDKESGFIIGNVNDKNFNLKKAVEKYNKKFETVTA